MGPATPEPWYVLVRDQPQGPFDDARMQAFAAQGKIRSSTLVRRGTGPWVKAEQVSGMFPTAARAAPVAVPIAAPSARSPSRRRPLLFASAAGLLVVGVGAFALFSGGSEPSANLPEVATVRPTEPPAPRAVATPTPPPAPTPLPTPTASPAVAAPPRPTATATATLSATATASAAAPSATASAKAIPSATATGTAANSAAPARMIPPNFAAIEQARSLGPAAMKVVNVSPLPERDLLAYRDLFVFSWNHDGAVFRWKPYGIWLDSSGEAVVSTQEPFGLLQSRLVDAGNSAVHSAGCTAVLPGKRLALMKTDRTQTPQPLPTGPAAQPGDVVYALGVDDPGAFGVPTAGRVEGRVTGEELADLHKKQKKNLAFLDHDGRYLKVKYEATPPDTHLLLNNAGQVVGLALSQKSTANLRGKVTVFHYFPDDPESNTYYILAADHLAELKSLRRTSPVPLIEISRYIFRNGKVVLQFDEPAASKPATVASAPNLSGPRPASKTNVVRPAALNPAAPNMPVPNAPPPVALNTPDKLAGVVDFRALVAERKTLFEQANEINNRIQGLRNEAAQVDAEYKRLDAQARPLVQEADRVQRLISNQEFLRSQSRDSIDRLNWDQVIQSNKNLLGTLQSRYQALVRASQPLLDRFRSLTSSIGDEQRQLQTLTDAGNRLRRRFVEAVDPYGTSFLPDNPEFAAFFTELIDADDDAQVGYAGRACSEIRAGKLDEASATLDKLIVLAPKDAYYLALRGTVRHRQGRLAESTKDFADALKFEKDFAPAHHCYALALLRNGAYAPFETAMKAAGKADPDDADGLLLLAFVKATSADDKVRNVEYAERLFAALPPAAPADRRRALVAAAIAAERGDHAKASGSLAPLPRYFSHAALTAQFEDWRRTILRRQPLRVDFKTFDAWTLW